VPKVLLVAACVTAGEVTSSGRTASKIHVRVMPEERTLCDQPKVIDVLIHAEESNCDACIAALAERRRRGDA